MGGMGKTTLARRVFQDDKIRKHFGNLVWVYVSEKFDASAIFNEFLGSLIGEEVRIRSQELVLRKLSRALENKNYFLVLDDVWNDDRNEWNNFINSLLGITSIKGNAIIVTTRNKKVASIVETLPAHELTDLSKENCWSIIKATTFKEREVPTDFETIGKAIAERCQGLPLAANVVGGLLLDKSKDDWVSIEQNWLSNFTQSKDIMQILKLSFDNLPSPLLKKCFAYCSIFKKGSHINPVELIELWMAEGFLQIDESSDMETTGSTFFDILLQNSLLQVVRRDKYGDIRTCSMHDLVHDLACYVLGSNSNSKNDNILDGAYRVRYINMESLKDDMSLFIQEQARYLRMILFIGQIPNKILSALKSMHTLILIGMDVENLPVHIEKLMHLRYLCIDKTGIETLPDSIGELYHLQTLRARYHLKRLPKTLSNLISLRHLHIPKIELPPGMGRLTFLHTLPHFNVGLEKGCRISELGSLKHLKGGLEIHNLENVHDKDEAKSADLFNKSELFELKFAWNKLRVGEANDEDVMKSLQPQPNLKSLEIFGFRGKRLPLWASKMGVQNDNGGNWIGFNSLVELILKDCHDCEEAPTLGHLANLKTLLLSGLRNVKSLGSSFYEDVKCGTIREVSKKRNILFPKLKSFHLLLMPNLIEWEEVGLSTATQTQLQKKVVAFPCLEFLKIAGCDKLKTAPSLFPCLKKLIIEGMESDGPLTNICSSVTSLTELHIWRVDGLICLPHKLFFNNQNLSYMKVRSCLNITYLVSHIEGGRTSLKELGIYDCPNLEKMTDDPSGGQSLGFTSLFELEIYKCPKLTTLPLEMVESFQITLERLSLGNVGLSNLNMVFRCLKEMPRLMCLEIFGVPKFAILPMKAGSLRSLQKLKFGEFSNSSRDFHSFNETLESILGGVSQCIRSLTLIGNEDWDSLPNKIQDLTTLSTLKLREFGVESLPEWLENLSSLERLWLWRCGKLRNLPSKEAMQRLTKLRELCIWGCPELGERCRREEGTSTSNNSEWPKISHIQDLQLWIS